MSRMSRREFLRATATASAAMALGGQGCADSNDVFPLPSQAALDSFDHLVVIMFENRSLDMVFGGLYGPDGAPRGQTFDGVLGKDIVNFGPDGTPFSPMELTQSLTPNVDFGEEYQHVNVQLWGEFDPAGNADQPYGNQVKPYNIPPGAGTPTMSGFVTDYVAAYRQQRHGREATNDELAQVMGYLSPDLVPTFYTLAREFGVYDRWHCDVPANTYANRSFFHSGQSYGMLNTSALWPFQTTNAPTIFNRMADRGVPWKVYWPTSQIVSTTLICNWRGICHLYDGGQGEHWASMEQFYDDVDRGRLPKYSFIEPRMWFDNNDMHPTSPVLEFRQNYENTRSYVTAADRLLHDVYDAIRRSSSESGSNAENTLLLITFDEHGGSHDHVVPAPAAPPDQTIGDLDFRFDRLGIRIPTVAVSAHIEPGTVVNDPMMGTSVLATVRDKWDLGPPLTNRDANAPHFTPVINRREARSAGSWPITTPPPVPPDSVNQDHELISELGDYLVRSVMEITGEVADFEAPRPTTSEAKKVLTDLAKGLDKACKSA